MPLRKLDTQQARDLVLYISITHGVGNDGVCTVDNQPLVQ